MLFLLAASPTLWPMLVNHQTFDANWVNLTYIRSSDHSFPSSWWQTGNAEFPRFVILCGLGALSLSFPAPRTQQRKTLLILAAAGVVFVAGYVFSEIWPSPTILRAQLFRSSRLLLIVLLIHIAHGVVRAWRMPWTAEPVSTGLSRWQRWTEMLVASATFLVLVWPALMPLLPLIFLANVVVAIVNARLSWFQALASAGVLVVCVGAWQELSFPLWELPAHAVGQSLTGLASLPWPFWPAIIAAALLIHPLSQRTRRRAFSLPVLSLASLALWALLFACAYARFVPTKASTDPWIAAQLWAKQNTPSNAVFLTPTQPGGFRIYSERSVVGEWRDGTQLYFSSAFAPVWWERMAGLQPGLLLDDSGRQVLARGEPLAELDDDELIALAKRFDATHILLPPTPAHDLIKVYQNGAYAIYLPKIPERAVPAEALSKDAWQKQEQFMRDTVLPNIEKYRKSNAAIQVVDETGRPVFDLPIEVRQVRQSFGFSASLPFFGPTPPPVSGDYRPPPVQPKELDAFLQIFNHSLIPFSGKWMYIEPKEGERKYEDLDKYVNWCVENHIKLEYHFVSGYPPPWIRGKKPPQQAEALMKHARALAERYGDKIDSWQVVNEDQLMEHVPPVFVELRKLLPNAKLGVAHCAQFGSDPGVNRNAKNLTPADRRQQQLRGLETIRSLKRQGIQPDFFGFHGHRPFGLWPDAAEMYECLDTFAKEGVKIHVTEFTVSLGVPVLGPVRKGTFTPELQAEFYERFYTICYSHPAVEMINLWGMGPNTWQNGGGLLDDEYNPKPAFEAMRKLIKEKWQTNAAGKLGLDGAYRFRGFHGDYEATITLPDGKNLTAKLSLVPDQDTNLRLQLDSQDQSLKTLVPTTKTTQGSR